jgi:hypothetical protein
MNILNLAYKNQTHSPAVPKILFSKMEASLKSAGTSFEKNVRLAKTLAPILQDQSSNERHLTAISHPDAPIQEKIIAILMLGFPRNRQILPILQNIMINSSDAMRMAAAISISQMRDGLNNDLLSEILLAGFHRTESPEVKKTIRQAILSLIDKKSAKLVQVLFSDGL